MGSLLLGDVHDLSLRDHRLCIASFPDIEATTWCDAAGIRRSVSPPGPFCSALFAKVSFCDSEHGRGRQNRSSIKLSGVTAKTSLCSPKRQAVRMTRSGRDL